MAYSTQNSNILLFFGISALCMNCVNNSISTLMLARIRFFRFIALKGNMRPRHAPKGQRAHSPGQRPGYDEAMNYALKGQKR